MIAVASHPLLHLEAFEGLLPAPLGDLSTPPAVLQRLTAAPDPERPDTKGVIRALLRHGGFAPSGRNRPAWEYLDKANAAGKLGPINPAVDFCNAFSLHSGLPISVVDAERLSPPLLVDVAPRGSSYVFNPSGQVLDLGGLLCLFDADGPCAGPVKDSQRTKTHPGTTRTLTIIWGAVLLAEHARATAAAYRRALGEAGISTRVVPRV